MRVQMSNAEGSATTNRSPPCSAMCCHKAKPCSCSACPCSMKVEGSVLLVSHDYPSGPDTLLLRHQGPKSDMHVEPEFVE